MLIWEVTYTWGMIIRDKRPKLNTQADSIHEKIFLIVICPFSHFLFLRIFPQIMLISYLLIMMTWSDRNIKFLFFLLLRAVCTNLIGSKQRWSTNLRSAFFCQSSLQCQCKLSFKHTCVVNTFRWCKFDCLLYYLE